MRASYRLGGTPKSCVKSSQNVWASNVTFVQVNLDIWGCGGVSSGSPRSQREGLGNGHRDKLRESVSMILGLHKGGVTLAREFLSHGNSLRVAESDPRSPSLND